MGKTILLFGAGKSASYLIWYFLQKAASENWQIHVLDQHLAHLKEIFGDHPALHTHSVALENQAECLEHIRKADIVISLLPAFLHIKIARWCLSENKHLVTASYVDEAMQSLHTEAQNKGLIFLNEMGLDPGIDHLSAMELIHRLQAEGKVITGFESFTGGLVAPESDTNPWHYKFSWNPRNVILAGSGSSARYLSRGEYKYVSYPRLFQEIRHFDLGQDGRFEGYANRDSLKYRPVYGLESIRTMLRGTLRGEHFCKSWNVFVQLGMTDDSYQMEWEGPVSRRRFLNAFLPWDPEKSVEEKLSGLPGLTVDPDILVRLESLGLFSHDLLMPLSAGSPAAMLQALLETNWKLEAGDKDMIVMVHRIFYEEQGLEKRIESRLIVKGEDERFTAMAKTVGLPAAMGAELILKGLVKARGVIVPVQAEWYHPVLNQLKDYGIGFVESCD